MWYCLKYYWRQMHVHHIGGFQEKGHTMRIWFTRVIIGHSGPIWYPIVKLKLHNMQSRKKVMFTIKSLKSLSPQKARRLLISRNSWKKQKTDVLKLKWTEEAVIGRSCRTKSVWSMPVGPRFLRSLDLEQKLEQRIDLGIDLKLPSWKTYTTKQISKVQFFSVKF